MPKVKYYFNTHSLKYEKVVISIQRKLLRALAFISTAVVFASIIIVIAYSYFDSPKEKQLRREINQLTLQYESLNKQLDLLTLVIKDLQERDNNIYRVIFEAEPIDDKERFTTYGKPDRYKHLEKYDNAELMMATSKKIDRITKALYVQSKSFDQVFRLVKNKSEMMASIPAIQPISNRNLKMLASGFGYRIHPIYKTVKFHEGMDFTAATGTPIYATGNGIVEPPNGHGKGYGYHIVINHGYGYETLYAHMSKIAVKAGQRVKRGQVVGYVGSTGSSVGPHLHYEVIRNGAKINPINFYYNDLSPLEYEKMRQISAQANQSFD
jgi:murein DD-endopeptidase MepM/ murein hydrolase activator NlpD